MKKLVTTLAIVANTIVATSAAATTVDSRKLYTDETVQAAYVQAKIREHFPDDYNIVRMIAWCESRSRPFIQWEPDGSLRGRDDGNGSAAGTLQILLSMKVHGPAIAELELNMHNLDDYLTFAKLLMDNRAANQGERHRYDDWNESRPCWEPRLANS